MLTDLVFDNYVYVSGEKETVEDVVFMLRNQVSDIFFYVNGEKKR